ncbi:MAG: PorT family protein [Acidobacteria bacterium]|nr:PorT family protein [Acidobacteriota bacterium]
MNKRLIILSGLAIATLLTPTMASAQVGGGVKVGINLSNVKGFNDDTTSSSQRTGLVAGGFMTFGLSPMLAFQPEVLFSMQGSKLHFSSNGVDTNATRKVDYLQIPLLLRIGTNSREHASVYAIAGPTLGILVRATENGTNIKSSVKRTDVGVVAGVGVSITRLLLEARYTYDLVDFNKVEQPSGAHKNRVVSFLVGVVF